MKKYKYIFLTLSLVIIILILSYLGVSFFTKGFNEFDYLLINILGDALLVGIVTHISSKTISMHISKKEFERNNKINVTLNKNRNGIINYNDFMSLYQNKDVYFLMNESDKRIIEYVYKLYDCFLSIMKCEGVEEQLLDTVLNLPFCIDFIENNDIPDSYNEIIKKIDSHKRFDNISILKEVLLNEKDIKRLEKFSNIMSNIKHYEIANLNCVEGNQLLITANNIVACKIPCLPSHKYDLFIYYDKEQWMDIIAFSFDYDSKEYATNISGFKYTNIREKIKPVQINLQDYININ